MTQSHESGPPLGRWEVLGAWLHVWTPPRGAQIPPVPWRAIGIWTAVAVIALGIAAAVAIPRIDAAKRQGAARDAAASARSDAAERARVVASQTPHRGRAARPAGTPSVTERLSLFSAAKAAVLADARARVRAGTLDSPVSAVDCVRAPQGAAPPPPDPERHPTIGAAAYDCTAITGRIAAGERNVAGALGYPFRLKVDFSRFTFLWCKQTPVPGEQLIPDPRNVVPLPRVCRI
ncbi:MAG: hypothetical protein QOE86_3359 [Solirubrobacteraceae bacterium]|jgi:hypothetical protein|nr:hypothetical protein [Solirubrobacteraceae bacterium]